MKKEFSFPVKIKYLLMLFVAAFAITVPVRTYQYFTVIAPKTGFYTSLNAAVYILYIALAVFSLAFIVISLLSSEAVESKMPRGKSKLLAVSAIIFAVCFIIDAIKQISAFFMAFIGYSAGSVRPGLWKYLTSNGYIPVILEAVFALCAAIYMIVFGISYLSGKNTFEDSKLLALGPMLWAVSKMIACLMQPISYVKVSELLLELFALAFIMLCFLSFARVSSQLSEKGEMRKIFAFGFPAALFSLVCSIPRIVMILIAQPSRLADGYGVDVTLLASALFIIVYIGTTMYLGNREVPGENDETGEETLLDDDFLSEE